MARRRRTVPANFAPEWTADRFAEHLVNQYRPRIVARVIPDPPYVDRKLWQLVISPKQWKFLRALCLRGHAGYNSYSRHYVRLEGKLPTSGYEWWITWRRAEDGYEHYIQINEPGGFSTEVDPKWQRMAAEQGCTVGEIADRLRRGEVPCR